MIKRLHKRKEYIVILLLTGFISVFVCDALCDFGVISWGNYSAVVNKTDTHPKKRMTMIITILIQIITTITSIAMMVTRRMSVVMK